MTGTRKWLICPICKGDGTYVNPNIDAHGLTTEDFQEDPTFMEDYFEGVYNVPCKTCSGSGKLLRSEWSSIKQRLEQAAEDRKLAAREDGNYEAYRGAGDYRYGY